MNEMSDKQLDEFIDMLKKGNGDKKSLEQKITLAKIISNNRERIIQRLDSFYESYPIPERAGKVKECKRLLKQYNYKPKSDSSDIYRSAARITGYSIAITAMAIGLYLFGNKMADMIKNSSVTRTRTITDVSE